MFYQCPSLQTIPAPRVSVTYPSADNIEDAGEWKLYSISLLHWPQWLRINLLPGGAVTSQFSFHSQGSSYIHTPAWIQCTSIHKQARTHTYSVRARRSLLGREREREKENHWRSSNCLMFVDSLDDSQCPEVFSEGVCMYLCVCVCVTRAEDGS